MTKLAQLQYQ